MNTQQLTNEALDAFWQVIVQHFPKATSGDLSPLATFQLDHAAEAAIKEWISNNVTTQEGDIAAGYRFSLFRLVDRFPDFLAPADLTGVVTAVTASGVWGRMDQHIAGAEQWDNHIHWHTSDDFARDTVPFCDTRRGLPAKGSQLLCLQRPRAKPRFHPVAHIHWKSKPRFIREKLNSLLIKFGGVR